MHSGGQSILWRVAAARLSLDGQGRPSGVTSRYAYVTEIPCARRGAVRSSERNEHVRASNKSSTRICCDLRLGGICLGARAECFPTIAPACPHRCESRRAQLRGDDGCIGQLRARCRAAIGQCTGSSSSIFQNSGADPVLGSIAVSRRTHLRACAACARLKL